MSGFMLGMGGSPHVGSEVGAHGHAAQADAEVRARLVERRVRGRRHHQLRVVDAARAAHELARRAHRAVCVRVGVRVRVRVGVRVGVGVRVCQADRAL